MENGKLNNLYSQNNRHLFKETEEDGSVPQPPRVRLVECQMLLASRSPDTLQDELNEILEAAWGENVNRIRHAYLIRVEQYQEALRISDQLFIQVAKLLGMPESSWKADAPIQAIIEKLEERLKD